MVEQNQQQALLKQAVAGDRTATEQLLWTHYDRLQRFIDQNIPPVVRSTVSADDVLQETFVVAWQQIADFEERHTDALYTWLRTIAKNKLTDRVRAQAAAKRGGGKQAVDKRGGDSSMADLVDLVIASAKSPSGSVARREAERITLVTLAHLKEDYRRAITLRYLEGRSVAETATAMDRTERSIHMLCNRALKKLREALGRSSHYLSK
jgi:RNA polymerase sigma-70 factor (ECF subfamily)